MNFDFARVHGETLQLAVDVFKSRTGDQIGFKPSFEAFDSLIWSAIRDSKSGEEIRQEEYKESWEILDTIGGSVRMLRHDRSEYASMRIYHLSGDYPSTDLVKGDEWEVRVVKCYAQTQHTPRPNGPDQITWTEPRTRDGRIKIHFTVTPIKRRVDDSVRLTIWDPGHIEQRFHCGSNMTTVITPFTKVEGPFRYTDTTGGDWVVYGTVAQNGTQVLDIRDERLVTVQQWISIKNPVLARHGDPKTLKRLWSNLPECPIELWNEARKTYSTHRTDLVRKFR